MIRVMEELKTKTLETTGLMFSDEGWDGWESRVAIAARDMGFADAAALARRLLSERASPEEKSRWIDHLTVGETYFWRETEAFDALERHVIPLLTRGLDREIRVWIAGCSTGEEAYSVAIALTRALIPASRARLWATDLNPRSLAVARAGVYRAWSFRNAPEWLRELYFTEVQPGRWKVRSEVQPVFEGANLVDAAAFSNGSWDLILCRNVLMYLSPESVSVVLERMHSSLTPNGVLMLSASELALAAGVFQAERVGGTQVFRRRDRRPEARKVVSVAAKPMPRPQPISEPPSLAQVRALAEKGRLDEALVLCREMTERNALAADGHSLLGLLCEQSGDHSSAITAYRRALYLDPHDAFASLAMGRLYQRLGDERSADIHFRNAESAPGEGR